MKPWMIVLSAWMLLANASWSMQIFVKEHASPYATLTLEVAPTDDIEDVKDEIRNKPLGGYPPNLQMLYFNGLHLQLNRTLGDYGIVAESTLHLWVPQISPSNGPYAGGNTVAITNAGLLGNGTDITNVVVGGVGTTNIPGQGTNWVSFVAPAASAAGSNDIVIYSGSVGTTTLASAYTYNPAGVIGGTNADWTRWEEVASLPNARYDLAVSVLNGALYAIGGNTTGDVGQTNVYRYNGTNWIEVAGLPVAQAGLGAGVLNGALYAFGGWVGSGPATNVCRYDGTNWMVTNGLPAARNYEAGGVLNEMLYVVGGFNDNAKTNVYRYDGTNWTQNVGLPAARGGLVACALNGALYAVGGFGAGLTAQTNVYRYDGTNWTEVLGLPSARACLAGEVLNGTLYAIGGYNSTAESNVYSYNGTNWTTTASLPEKRMKFGAGVLNNGLYAVGGNNDSGARSNVYRYPALTAYTGVNPSSGSVTGGYQVVITGTNLSDGTDVTNVTICGVNASSISMAGSTQVVVTTGAGSPGIGDVRVYSTSAGESVGLNKFTYIGPVMTLLGTNGAAIASGASASSELGTDFGTFTLGAAAVTNTFAITNSGDATLTISGVTTNGSPLFQCSSMPASVAAGTASNFSIVFNPNVAGVATASVAIANDSTNTPYVVNIKGTVNGAETNLPAPTGVSATYGTYTNIVRVTWTGVAGATSYDILRNTTPDVNRATFLHNEPASQGARGLPAVADGAKAGQRSEVSDQQPSVYSLQPTVYYYDDYTVLARQSYYYWVRALGGSGVSALSYVGMGYAELGSGQTVGRSDLTVSDMVFLPVNLTNGSPAGTVSYRLAIGGPDTLTAAPVRFDFYMVQGNQAAWMAYNETNVTLAVGAEQLLILDASVRQWLRVRGDLVGQYTVQAKVRHLALIEDGHTGSNTTDAAGTVLVRASGINSPGRSINDYDGDGKSDVCLYQGTLGRWYAKLSGDRYSTDPNIGDVGMGWSPVAGDYDGDGLTDVAAYERSSGHWLVLLSSNGLVAGCYLGGPEFTAAQCDFDGDSMTDLLVYREADEYWEGAASSRRYALCSACFDQTEGQPVVADYDGDRLADLMVYDESNGMWFGALSSAGYHLMSGGYGGPGFMAVPADYDGDGRVDFGLYEYATGWWYVLMSNRSTGPIGQGYREASGQLGAPYGMPVVADYDGDGLADPAVYHIATGLWQIYLSSQGYACLSGGFGGPEYQPVTE